MFYVRILLCLLIFSISACKKPQGDPQAGDYIYQQLKVQLAAAEAKLAERKTQLDEFKTTLAQADESEYSRKRILKTKAEIAARDIQKLEQRVRYWKLKILSREEYVRTTYLSSFNKGIEWDNKEETEKFRKAEQRLVPRAPASKSPGDSKAEKKKESESAPPAH